jgi:hypothetical protein
MLNLSDVIELTGANDTAIFFRCPSRVQRIVKYDVRISDDKVLCGCKHFQCRCKAHAPTQRDSQFHCPHIKAALEFLNASPTIEEMEAELDAADCCAVCGQILEEINVPLDSSGDYVRVWDCPSCAEMGVRI